MRTVANKQTDNQQRLHDLLGGGNKGRQLPNLGVSTGSAEVLVR